MTNQPTPEQLATINAAHLTYLEQVLVAAPFNYTTISLALPFCYELIQLTNHAYLVDLLGDAGEESAT